MQAPPPVYETPQRPKNRTGCIVAGILVGVLAVCCGGAFFMWNTVGKGVVQGSFGVVGCGLGISQTREALMAYADAHDGRFPKADHWQDDVAKYYKTTADMKNAPFKIPNATSDFCDSDANTSIVFNRSLAGKKLSEIKSPDKTVLLFEAKGTGRNRSLPYQRQNPAEAPTFFKGTPRGWMEQPIYGDAYLLNKGRRQPINVNARVGER